MSYYVYIMANTTNTTIYTGMTNDLLRRIYIHKNNLASDSFTAKYAVHKLVYYEEATTAAVAIAREKQIKSWNRRRKNELISAENPSWEDLYPSVLP